MKKLRIAEDGEDSISIAGTTARKIPNVVERSIKDAFIEITNDFPSVEDAYKDMKGLIETIFAYTGESEKDIKQVIEDIRLNAEL